MNKNIKIVCILATLVSFSQVANTQTTQTPHNNY